MREDIFINTERETALNTHRLQRVVSHNTILSANEQIDFVTLIFLFFCSFTDKILNSYIDISSIDNSNKKVINTKKYLGKDAPSRARQLSVKGDIIISTVRPNLNAVAIIENDYENLIASTGFCVLRCKNEFLNNYYLFALLTSEYFISEMTKIAKGASYPAISNNDIFNHKIPIPTMHLQLKYSELFITINSMRQKYESSLIESENLFNSLMQKAFKGDL